MFQKTIDYPINAFSVTQVSVNEDLGGVGSS